MSTTLRCTGKGPGSLYPRLFAAKVSFPRRPSVHVSTYASSPGRARSLCVAQVLRLLVRTGCALRVFSLLVDKVFPAQLRKQSTLPVHHRLARFYQLQLLFNKAFSVLYTARLRFSVSHSPRDACTTPMAVRVACR